MQQERSRAALQGRCSKGGAGDSPVTALGLRAPVASQGHATHSHRTPRPAPALPHTSPSSAPTGRAAHGGRSRSSVSLRECGPGLRAGGRGFMPVSHSPGLRTMRGRACRGRSGSRTPAQDCPTEAQVQPQLAKCRARQGCPFPGPGHRVPRTGPWSAPPGEPLRTGDGFTRRPGSPQQLSTHTTGG